MVFVNIYLIYIYNSH